MYTIKGRIESCDLFWGNMLRSLAPLRQKLRLLSTVAWPRCFYSAAVVPIGSDHFNKLRTKAMNSLKWSKKGASPLIQLSLVSHPSSDPGFHVLWETIQAFRRCGNNPTTITVMDHLCNHQREPRRDPAQSYWIAYT